MADTTYFETSWAILSTIGVFLMLAGLSVMAITHVCILNFVPIIVSIGCALANGLCYYVYYRPNTPVASQIVGSVFADIFWLTQELGISFYNYQIISHIIRGRPRTIYLVVFWLLAVCIIGLRTTILVLRVLQIENHTLTGQNKVSRLHTGYFTAIAVLETWSAFFLIRQLAIARLRSPSAESKQGVLRYLLLSAELRLGSLCFIGISRAVTYSFQGTQQAATTAAAQVDRFVYTIECMFPVVLLLDILGSKRYRNYGQSQSTAGSQGRDSETLARRSSTWGSGSSAGKGEIPRRHHLFGMRGNRLWRPATS